MGFPKIRSLPEGLCVSSKGTAFVLSIFEDHPKVKMGESRVWPKVQCKTIAGLGFFELPRVMMEQAQVYDGMYFVLMGRLSPLDGVGPKDIHLDRLVKRALDGIVKETILATNFTVEGEATAHYVGELLGARGMKVSRIARGLPVGGELEHVDSGTLAQAMIERRPV